MFCQNYDLVAYIVTLLMRDFFAMLLRHFVALGDHVAFLFGDLLALMQAKSCKIIFVLFTKIYSLSYLLFIVVRRLTLLPVDGGTVFLVATLLFVGGPAGVLVVSFAHLLLSGFTSLDIVVAALALAEEVEKEGIGLSNGSCVSIGSGLGFGLGVASCQSQAENEEDLERSRMLMDGRPLFFFFVIQLYLGLHG